jgi:hypothetical protein
VPGADQVENLTLAPSQPERMSTGGGSRPGGDRPDAEQAHLLPGDLRGGGCAEVGEDLQSLAQRSLFGRVVQGQRGSYGQPRPVHSRAAASQSPAACRR